MSATQHVLETVKGRSLHFPKLLRAGRIKRVSFFQSFEILLVAPFFSWCLARTVFKTWRTILNVTALFSSFRILCRMRWSLPLCPFPRAGKLLRVDQKVVWILSSFLPVELALHFGWGMVRALAALHRAGFVHRLVSPHSFSYITPPTMNNIVNRLLITDLSLAMPWPKKLVVLNSSIVHFLLGQETRFRLWAQCVIVRWKLMTVANRVRRLTYSPLSLLLLKWFLEDCPGVPPRVWESFVSLKSSFQKVRSFVDCQKRCAHSTSLVLSIGL